MSVPMRLRCSMSVEQAHDILETYGSASDPILVGGVETTPADLAMDDPKPDRPATSVRLQFFGKVRGRHGVGLKHGTLCSMVFDRMDLHVERLP